MSLESAIAAIMGARYRPSVGDHVRVLDRPECTYCTLIEAYGDRPARTQTRDEMYVGATAIIDHIEPSHDAEGCQLWDCDPHGDDPKDCADHHAHSVWVTFDVPQPDGVGGVFTGYYFAPEELERIP